MNTDINIDFLLQNVRSIANDVLDRAFPGSRDYPIDLQQIAENFGVPIYEEELESNLAGYFIAETGKSAIVINKRDPVFRKRFTTAHELGHFISYKLQEKVGSIYDERGMLSGLGSDPEEIFANKFAAEILMPEHIFKEKLESSDDEADFNKVDLIANYFNVSKRAIEIRAKTLYGNMSV